MKSNISAEARLATEKVGRLLWEFSVPAVIGMIATSLYNIADRIFIGQGVGVLAISGLTLTFPLMNIISAIGTLVGVGAASRLSIVLGMNDIPWTRRIVSHAFMLTLLFSLVTISTMMYFLDDILLLFGGSEQTIPYARKYLNIVLPGSVLTNICYSFSNMIRAVGYPRKAMSVIILGVVINLILDPLFIFGFDMGIEGAAIATVISMFIGGCYALSHFLSRKNSVRFSLEGFIPRKHILYNITSIGMAPFLMNMAAAAVAAIINKQLVQYGGDLAVGAFGIINSYMFIVGMSVVGVANGMQPIVGFNYGANNLKRVRDTLRLTIKAGTVIVVAAFCICQLFPGLLTSGFTDDQALTHITVPGMRIVMALLPLIGFQIVVGTFFQSIGRAGISIFLSLSRQVIFLIPFLCIFPSIFGLNGVWMALPASDVLSFSMSVLMLAREKKRIFSQQYIA